jgi:hypothetical protein
MLPEDTNETEVLSDQLEICQDIIAQLRYNNFEFDEGLSATLILRLNYLIRQIAVLFQQTTNTLLNSI